MLRRSFLRLAGATVLGVLTAKVPVFAEEMPAVGPHPANVYGRAPRGLAYLVGPTGRILQGVNRTFFTASVEGSAITVPFELSANFDSTWRLTDVRS